MDIHVIGNIWTMLLGAPLKWSSELSSSALGTVLPFQQLRLCISLGFACHPDGYEKVVRSHFDITIMLFYLFVCFFLSCFFFFPWKPHSVSDNGVRLLWILPNDKKQNFNNCNQPLFCWGMLPQSIPQNESKAPQFRDTHCPMEVESK